jgi:hypothetical protein
MIKLKTILKIQPEGCSLTDIAKILDVIQKAFENDELFVDQKDGLWIISRKVTL